MVKTQAEQLESLERGFEQLIVGETLRTDDRKQLYEKAMKYAGVEFRKSEKLIGEYHGAVSAGIAPDWMVQEYLLERHRMNRLVRMHKDRQECYAVSEVSEGDFIERTIAINGNRSKRE
jgi:hypothetical protein